MISLKINIAFNNNTSDDSELKELLTFNVSTVRYLRS